MKKLAEVCKVCGAPRARKADGAYIALALCAVHQRERNAANMRNWKAKNAAATGIGAICSWYNDVRHVVDVPARPVATAVARRRARRRPLRLHRRVKQLIVMADYATLKVLYVRGHVVCSVPMPKTHGELKRIFIDHHHEGYAIAQ